VRALHSICSASLLLALLGACHTKAAIAPPEPGLVAALERQNEIVIVRQKGGEWVPEKHLPRSARALRFSPNGGTVSWVVDELGDGGVAPAGYAQGWGVEKPEPLGTLGLRTRAAMGLATANEGQVAFLSEGGELKVLRDKQATLGLGSDAIPGPPGEWAFVNSHGCLASTDGLVPLAVVCGNAVRPLQYADGLLLARDNHGLILATKTEITRVVMPEVVDARARKRVFLATRRVNEKGRLSEAVTLLRRTEPQREVTRGAVIVSAGFDLDGSVLVVRAPARDDLYQLMLAHAPEEFGGEALSGHAYRYSAVHLTEAEVPGLELERVRALFYAR
jgi:hypothetical protein